VSETYFARLLGLPFIAVMPATTAKRKIEQITFYDGRCHFVADPCQMYAESERLDNELNGHFMDQFTFAEHATDWRGNNNIADSIFQQMRHEPFPIPETIMMSAGTGGTSATVGRYLRYQGHATRLVVVDPENSVFFDYWHRRNKALNNTQGSKIEGIGRPRVEPSFIAKVVDKIVKVPDIASIATMLWLEKQLGRKVGPSTGTNVWGALQVAKRMKKKIAVGQSSRYCATAANVIWTLTTIRPGRRSTLEILANGNSSANFPWNKYKQNTFACPFERVRNIRASRTSG